MALFGFLTRQKPSSDLPDTLRKLDSRVGQLEALQVTRELEWAETRDKILRYLKRIQEVERRGGGETSPARSALLRAKFPNQREG